MSTRLLPARGRAAVSAGVLAAGVLFVGLLASPGLQAAAAAPGPAIATPATTPATPALVSAAARPALRYLLPTATIRPAKGCTVLTPGMNGVKVKLVQHRLGFAAGKWETMDAATILKVKTFQRGRHLPADGVVGPATWRALGIREDFCMDRWQAKPVVPVSASAGRRVEQFIRYAGTYLGHEYVWGGAGQPRYGIDCSGLVLQSLYSAGIDPQPISVDRHVEPTYRTSLELYRYAGFRHLPAASMKRGDLVFYRSNATGTVNHVAIYLGGGRLLEAKGSDVHTVSIGRRLPAQTMMPLVVRPIA